MKTTENTASSYEELFQENQELRQQIVFLQAEFTQLRRLIFGSKSERHIPGDVNQLHLFAGDVAASSSPTQVEDISYKRRKPAKTVTPHGRKPLPADLPRRDIIIEPEEDTSGCKKIGEEITEELEYEPARFFVKRYIRPKYARPDDEGVIIAALPSRPIEKGIPGPGLLTQILINKYVDHLPLYRQRNRFKRLGMDIPESTIDGWVKAAYELLAPLEAPLKKQILNTSYLMSDDTSLKVQDKKKKGKTHKGYFWVYYDPLWPAVYFDYRKGRGAEGPQDMLENFSGYLQCDGYAVYDEYQKREDITLIGCFAHARRKFFDARFSDAKRANEMLDLIGKLYKIERKAKDGVLDFKDRHELRHKEASPILKDIKDWLDEQYPKVLPKSGIGGAIAYSLNQWPRLINYLADGRIEIDNNLVENAIRPVALGRKNWLFAGSHAGARRAALIFSLVSTAKLHEVEPFAYLRDVLARINDHPHKQIEDLLPPNWKAQSSS